MEGFRVPGFGFSECLQLAQDGVYHMNSHWHVFLLPLTIAVCFSPIQETVIGFAGLPKNKIIAPCCT